MLKRAMMNVSISLEKSFSFAGEKRKRGSLFRRKDKKLSRLSDRFIRVVLADLSAVTSDIALLRKILIHR